MPVVTTNMITEEITSSKTYQEKIQIAVLNSHSTDGLRVKQADGTFIVLAPSQSVVLSAPTGTVLPDITIETNDTSLKAEIVAMR